MNKTTLNSQKEKHSLLSLRRATFRRQRARRGPQHFYPRSPCGERRCQTLSDCRYTAISIHALLAESDARFKRERKGMIAFLSTLSLRRATKICKYVARRNVISIHALLAESDIYCHLSGASYSISIHALLAESDYIRSIRKSTTSNFYPRSPCGERRRAEIRRT